MKTTKTVTEVFDDFDGTPADQSVRFAFNGATYEIDLTRAHFEEFAEALQPWIKAGRRIGSGAPRSLKKRRKRTQREVEEAASISMANAKMRKWAGENGYSVSPKGRIPQKVVEAYLEANPNE